MRPVTAEPDTDGSVLPLSMLIELRHTARVDLSSAGLGLGSRLGPYRGVRRGQGLDFDDLRRYTDGDDIRRIDWKVTARYNEVHTRLYREEKDHVVTVALDFRGCMFTGSSVLRSVQAGRQAALLVWGTVQSGGRCGVVVLHDRGVSAIAARAGESGALAACGMIAEQFSMVRDSLLHTPSPSIDDSSCGSLLGLTDWLLQGGRSLGEITLFSALDDLDAEIVNKLQILSRRISTSQSTLHLTVVLDAMESTGLPAGTYSYISGGRRYRTQLSRAQSSRLDLLLKEQRATLRRTLMEAGLRFTGATELACQGV